MGQSDVSLFFPTGHRGGRLRLDRVSVPYRLLRGDQRRREELRRPVRRQHRAALYGKNFFSMLILVI